MAQEYAKIAVEGREEMTFWPLAVAILLFSQTGEQIFFAATTLLAFTGTISFLSLRRARKSISNSRSKNSTYNRSSRKGVQKSRVDNFTETIESVNSTKIFLSWMVVCVNLFIGFVFFYILGSHLAVTNKPGILEIGLFILPFLYLATIIWVIIFK